ncbi:hypothetical protein IQ266_16760 [filamentous cyanobacterium LEGE 11480]|uniref:Low temperature-induced protein n=1 Tax=Romeriopsis navalis LEGE 11480 TaxID=2777977 RepID=A0A928VRT3_9CYAN|nr:hypothetical protein [Romeriopsis navalis]MBE9031387.1 hypothetical protein [Romeriopsis navalis LEGE 11480]
MKTQRSFTMRLTTAFFAIVMFFGLISAPSFAGNIFSADKGETTQSDVLKQAEKVAGSEPRSLEEVQSQSKGGLNGVQGTAGYQKMEKDTTIGKPDNVIARKVDKALSK